MLWYLFWDFERNVKDDDCEDLEVLMGYIYRQRACNALYGTPTFNVRDCELKQG